MHSQGQDGLADQGMMSSSAKRETLLNMKTAKALGLNVPELVRLRGDEVID
jgi:hypothetical protein